MTKKKSKKKVKRNTYYKQQGNIVLVTAILILIVSIIVATCVNLAGVQSNLANLNRDTSGTYSLAVNAVDKEVDTINKALQIELTEIVKKISDEYIPYLAGDDSERDYSKFAYVVSDGVGRLKIKNTTDVDLQKMLEKKVYAFVQSQYFDRPIEYSVQSDREEENSVTNIVVNTTKIIGSEKTVKVTATATTVTPDGVIYDQQTVSAIVEIYVPNADELKDQIKEYYRWDSDYANGCTSEYLASPLICFSDVIINDGNKLDVQTGDMLVRGVKQQSSSLMDVSYEGGVIVKNGGILHVANNLYCASNVIGTNGWEKTSGSYGSPTFIDVNGDVIADTIGILSDYYEGSENQLPEDHRGTNINIAIGKNAIVDNDVMIGPWVGSSNITVEGTIFGTSGEGDDTGYTKMITVGSNTVVDPNGSSGVFNQGKDCMISAERMIVGGQPFVVLRENGLPLKLFESIGEPFTSVNSIKQYRDEEVSSVNADLYLKADSPFLQYINAQSIKTDFQKSYAVAKITGINTGTALPVGSPLAAQVENVVDGDGNTIQTVKGYSPSTVFAGGSELWRFLFTGGSTVSLSSQTTKNADYVTADHIASGSNSVDFYKGDMNAKDYAQTYSKDFNIIGDSGSIKDYVKKKYLGLKAYSIAMRSPVYKGFDDAGKLTELTFDQAMIGVSSLAVHSWSLDTPIVVCDGGEIDIANFYVTGDYAAADYNGELAGNGRTAAGLGCYPTIIINKGNKPLTIYSSDNTRDTFNGIIISKGKLQLGSKTISGATTTLNINGTVIAGGTDSSSTALAEKTYGTEKVHINERVFEGDMMFKKTDGSIVETGSETDYESLGNCGLTVKNTVNINKASDILFKMEVKDRDLYRKVLEALKLVKYAAGTSVENIMKYSDSYVTYTKERLRYSPDSYLEVDTSKVCLKIISEKKEV